MPGTSHPLWPRTSGISSVRHTWCTAKSRGEFSLLGLRPKEFGSLSVLVSEGAMSQRRLGQRTGLDRTTMVVITDELERKGLVERTRNPEDRVPTRFARRPRAAVSSSARPRRLEGRRLSSSRRCRPPSGAGSSSCRT